MPELSPQGKFRINIVNYRNAVKKIKGERRVGKTEPATTIG